ncbi:MAG: hypothetical protein WCK96_15800 [Methylococcales bacterium]
MINPNLLELLKQDALLFDSSIHGLHHWETVERNGLYLAKFTGADVQVVSYFAYFHDCMRENERDDPKHGARGSQYAKQHKQLLNLSAEQLAMLCLACSGHTYGRQSSCATVATCWDADRLDLGRVGILPNSKYLLSDEAKRIADKQNFQILRGV